MTQNMMVFAWIILALFGLVLSFGIFLLVFLWGRKSVRNNPNKGLVFVKTGLQLLPPFKAIRDESCNKGSLFLYGNKQKVIVPVTYHETFFRGRRVIFVNRKHQLISSPFDDDVRIDESEKETLIYKLLESKIGSQSIEALQGKSYNVIVIAIVAFIIGAALAFVAFRYQDFAQSKQAAQIPITAPAPTNLPAPIEVK